MSAPLQLGGRHSGQPSIRQEVCVQEDTREPVVNPGPLNYPQIPVRVEHCVVLQLKRIQILSLREVHPAGARDDAQFRLIHPRWADHVQTRQPCHAIPTPPTAYAPRRMCDAPSRHATQARTQP